MFTNVKKMNYPQPIQERIILYDSTVLMALKKMDAINKKLLLVFNRDIFKGVLSIGDIQKAIINNLPMNTSIATIMRNDFLYARDNDEKKTIIHMMQQHRIECMPVLNMNKQLVTAYFWEDVFENTVRNASVHLNLPVVIMAGGQGLRLKPLTNILPKPLIPLGEKTIIEQIMDKFCAVGCNLFYISVNYKAEMIKYYLSNLENKIYNISYIQEDKPLGTVGSLSMLKGKISTTFFVSNCDILIDQEVYDIYEYHKKSQNEITLVAAIKNYPLPYGILETSKAGLLKSLIEKPELTFKINTGLYILEPHLIEEIPGNIFYHITSLIGKLQKENRKVGVFPISEKSWKDIGEWSSYINLFE